LGYELYGFVAEANGQSLPIAFAFTAMEHNTAAPGAKTRLIEQVLRHISKLCPNIAFALTDKDISEIHAVREVLPSVKHQLCCCHVLRYLDERMSSNRPPPKYNAEAAHSRFNFIDKDWVPETITTCTDDIEDPFDIREKETSKITFCSKEHRGVIREMHRVFMHLHPQIPSPFHNHKELNATEIHRFAVEQVYEYCRKHDLLVGVPLKPVVPAQAVAAVVLCRRHRHTAF
jgi:hypothetical protein